MKPPFRSREWRFFLLADPRDKGWIKRKEIKRDIQITFVHSVKKLWEGKLQFYN